MAQSTQNLESTLRQIQRIAISLLLSALLYPYAGEVLGPTTHSRVQLFLIVFGALAVTDVYLAFTTRARILGSSAQALLSNPQDQVALNRWRTGQIVALTMCEAICLFGFAVRMLGGTLLQSLPFYVVAIALMILWWPRRP